jgi:hypothetical protein
MWHRLAGHAPVTARLPELPTISVKRATYGYLGFWFVIKAVAATFFYLVSRSGPGEGMPLVLCVVFPGTVFGIVTLVRFLRQSR